MTDAISSRLLQLNELVAEESPLRGQESAEIARDLRAHCSQLRDESELARCSSILFDDKTGIIRFLHKTIANQEFVECKTELLKFLQSYLGQLNTRVNPYAVAIKVFPEHMLGNADRLISIYINLLNSEMKSKGNKSPDKQVIAGCLKGLSSYLVNFTQSAAEGSKFARDIYEFTRMAIDVQGTLQRYDVPRAGLNLLSRHAGQFQEYICTEHNPCKLFMTAEDVKFMFTEMMQRSEQIYLRQSEMQEDRVQQLPNFLEALSFIIEELDDISDGFLVSLERLIIVLFESFPRLSKSAKYLCHKALVKMLINISAKGSVLKNFLSEVGLNRYDCPLMPGFVVTVYQGLIRTCSHPVLLDEGPDVDKQVGVVTGSRSDQVTFKDYLPLWEHMLDKTKFKLTFKLGLSYLPLAQAGLAALEEWNASLPGDVLRPHLRNILPYLDGYLKSATDAVEEEQDQVSRRTATLRSTYSRLGKIVKPGEQPRKVCTKTTSFLWHFLALFPLAV
ncbi:predicted protein [Nematostella vectensis]|uniref:DNA-PKcs N-terminal domain-containing protein n=1 Tax=Nematostella vectensis TaxID=45351 RepID=A7S0T5_NEMVE|nr:predicted protein [Nematostella vectensis]|eukprot:XP_001634791.1 predicted protein [Nematostella vectensis]